MSRLFFFIAEGLRALRRSSAPSLAAIVTVAVTVILLGILIPVLLATSDKTEDVRDEVGLRVFLYEDGTKSEITELQRQIEAIPHVTSVAYVDKQEALVKLEGYLGEENDDILAELPNGRNPLPRSFEIQPDDLANLPAITSALQPPDASGTPRPISPIIEEVAESREESKAIESVTTGVKWFLSIIAVLLLVASLLLVGNTIRLSIYARRQDVEVMRLVGATNWFIRWPFMVEGLICGLIGAAAAIGLLFLGKVTIIDPLADNFRFFSAQRDTSIAFPMLLTILLGAGMLVSAIGSGITLRRFLRV
jgi:cell division transport system permease protein